jgi:hypothetical protein
MAQALLAAPRWQRGEREVVVRYTRILLLSAAVVATACSGPSSRSVTGSVSTRAFGLNVEVMAESSSGQVFASRLTSNGGFHLSLPTGQRYRIAVVQRTASGFHVLSRVSWTSGGHAYPWARVSPGDTLRLGHLRPLSASGSVGSNQQGNCDDGCDDGDDEDANDDGDGMSCSRGCGGDDENDDSQGDEQGQAPGVNFCDGGMSSQGNQGNDDCQGDEMGSDQGVSGDEGEQGDDDGNDVSGCNGDGGTGGGGGGGGGGDAGTGGGGGGHDAGTGGGGGGQDAGSGGGGDGGLL